MPRFALFDTLVPGLPVRTLAGLACAILLFTAWRQPGFVHPDEHYQILEFAWARLGHAPLGDLPWEFGERMRPALQPAIAAGVIAVTGRLGVFDPFGVALGLRLVSAVLALWVTLALLARILPRVRAGWLRRLAFVGALSFWALPGIFTRFSSENWGGLLVFAGLCVGLDALDAWPAARDRATRLAAAAGALWALAFFCRFQVAFALVGIAAWMVFVRKPARRLVAGAVLTALVVTAVNLCLDRWLYGQWVLSPLNYFRANILEGKASGFGTAPFWMTLEPFVAALGAPLGLVLLAAVAAGCWYARREVLFWAVVPFVVAHALVPHKEPRFMHPMFYALVPLIALAIDRLPAAILRPLARAVEGRTGRLVVLAVWTVNAIALVQATAVPANDRMEMLQRLWDQTAGCRARGAAVTLYSLDERPYGDILPINFYRPAGLTVLPLGRLNARDVAASGADRAVLVLYEGTGGLHLIPPVPIACRLDLRTPPPWLQWLGERGWVRRDRVWSLCDATSPPGPNAVE